MARAKISVEGPLQPEVQKTRAMGAEYRKKVTDNKELIGRQRERKTAEKVKLTGEQAAREAELLALANSEDSTIAEFGKEQLAAFYAGKPAEEPVVEEHINLSKDAKERMIKESETEARIRSRETERVVDFVQLCEVYGGGWPTVQLREFGPYIDRVFLDGKMTDLALQQYVKNLEVLAPAIKKSIDAKIEEVVKAEVTERTTKIGLSDTKVREALLAKITLDAGTPEKKQAHLVALQEAAEKGEFKVDLRTPAAAAVAIHEAMMGQDIFSKKDGVTISLPNERPRLSARDVVNIMATFETTVQDEIDDAKRKEIWELASKEEWGWSMSEADKKRKADLNRMYKGSDGVQAQQEFAASAAIAERLKDTQRILDVGHKLPELVAEILHKGAEDGMKSIESTVAYYKKDAVAKEVELEDLVEADKKDVHQIKIWTEGSGAEVVKRGKYDAAAVIRLRESVKALQLIAAELRAKPDFEHKKTFTQSAEQAQRLCDQVKHQLKGAADRQPAFVSAENIYLRARDKESTMTVEAREMYENMLNGKQRININELAREQHYEMEQVYKERVNKTEVSGVQEQRSVLLKKVEREIELATQTLEPTYYAKNWRETSEKIWEAKANKKRDIEMSLKKTEQQLQTVQESAGAWNEFYTGKKKAAVAELENHLVVGRAELIKVEEELAMAIQNYEKVRQFMLDISEK